MEYQAQSNQNNFDEGQDEGQFGQNELLETANSAAELVREVVLRRPVAAVAVGFGVGYVLGGGLPKFATRLVGAVGLRILAEGMIRGGAGRLLAGLGEQPSDDTYRGPQSSSDPVTSRPNEQFSSNSL